MNVLEDSELLRRENQALERFRRLAAQVRADLSNGVTAGANQHANTILNQERKGRRDVFDGALREDQFLYGKIVPKDGGGNDEIRIGRLTIWDSKNNVVVADWRAPISKNFFLSEDEQRNHFLMSATFTFDKRRISAVEVAFGGEYATPRRSTFFDKKPNAADSSKIITKPQEKPFKDPDLDVRFSQFRQTESAGSSVVTSLRSKVSQQSNSSSGRNVRAPMTLSGILRRRRSGKMSDHVNTLQPDQYRAVAAESNVSLIVTGGPGTGKSVVAIHRAMYLYGANDWQIRTLVIAPSENYSSHLAEVVDGSNKSEGKHIEVLTLEQLYRRVIDEFESINFDGRRFDNDFQVSMHLDPRFHEAARDFIWSFARPQSIELDVRGTAVRVDQSEIALLIERMKARKEPFGRGQTLLRELLHKHFKIAGGDTRKRYRFGKSPLDLFDEEIRSRWVLSNVFLPIQRFSKIAKEFLRVPEVGRSFLAAYFTESEIDQYFGASVSQREPFSNSELAVLLSMVLEVNGDSTHFKDSAHVIIEEFQDLGKADLLLIRRIFPDAVFTLAGDLNQASSAAGVESIEELKELLDIKESQEVSLELSFRVPKSLSNLAEAIRSSISRSDNRLLFSDFIENELDDDGVYYARYGHRRSVVSCVEEFCKGAGASGLTAVITSPDSLSKLRSQFKSAGVGYVTRLRDFETSTSKLILTTTIDVRGLEFDNVVVVDASAMLNDPSGRGHLFRAITRATRKVCIVDGDLDDTLRPFVTREL